MNYLLYVVAPCFVLAALFYGWLKWLNWRDAKPKRIPRNVVRAIIKGPLVLALLLPFAGCSTTKNADGSTTTTLDPELKTEGKSFVLAVLRAGEVKALEKITGRSVETVTTPVKVTAQK